MFQRGPEADPLIVFDNKGKYLRSFGKGMFGNPHGLRVDQDDNVFVTGNGDNQVMKFDKNGKLLLKLGIRGKAGTDDKTSDKPTDIAFARIGSNHSGDFYISDGYGNSRVLMFAADEKFLLSWASAAAGPANFVCPTPSR